MYTGYTRKNPRSRLHLTRHEKAITIVGQVGEKNWGGGGSHTNHQQRNSQSQGLTASRPFKGLLSTTPLEWHVAVNGGNG